jgi:Flp pilus assembly CpaF family ATPase
MGHQARQAHQEDVPTPLNDTQNVYLCRELCLRIPLPDVVAMQTRQPSLEGTGEVRLPRLIKEALRMRPSRIMGYR